MDGSANGYEKPSADNGSPRDVVLEAEQLLLFSLLVDPVARDDVLWRVKPDWFYHDAHQRIFRAIQTRHDRHDAVDAVLLAQDLSERGELLLVGGLDKLVRLGELYSHTGHAAYYAKLVREQHVKRSVRYSAMELIELVNVDSPLPDILSQAETTLGTLAETSIPTTVSDMKTILIEAMPEIDRRLSGQSEKGLRTGFEDVDRLLGGLNAGELIVIAARPGIGKSAFALNVALSAAHAGQSVCLFSLEMSRMELSSRLLSSEARVDANSINSGLSDVTASDREFIRDKLMQSASVLQELPIHLDDTAYQSMRSIRALSMRLKRREGLDLLIIDYLQLIEPEDKRVNREQQVATISRRLKVLAKELKVPVIVLAQLNRKLEAREEKRPVLSDLRESGSIEQDADKVCFLYRDPVQADSQGVAEFLVRKNRVGVSFGSVELGWISSQTRFADRSEMACYGAKSAMTSQRLGSKNF